MTPLPPGPVLSLPKPESAADSFEEPLSSPLTDDEPEPSPLDEVMVQNWTLQRYAWLCAELAHAPDHVEEVWLVYGVRDANTRRNVMGSWNAQLAAEPTLRNRHAELISHYRRMLGDKL